MYVTLKKYLASFRSLLLSLNTSASVILVCLINSGVCVSANNPKHVIITFDQSIGKYQSDYLSKNILRTIDVALKEISFDSKIDYVSMLAYTMEMGDPSIEKYVRPYFHNNSPFLWKHLENGFLYDTFSEWPKGQPLLNHDSAPFGSMQSLAKPYAVMAAKDKSNTLAVAEKTYLLLVTDGVVNGTDDNYAQEWNNVSTSIGADVAKFKNLAPIVFKTMQSFNEEFKFILKSRRPISLDGIYKIITYEVVSVERPSIYSISDIPSPLPMQRVRGGFKISIDSHALTSKYVISNIKIIDSTGIILGNSDSGKLDFILPSDKVAVGDSVSLSLSVLLKDGLYDGVIITPENPYYKDGMAIKQVVKIQDEAKVLGILPLNDAFWWWFPNDIFSAVMVWDLVILLILIIIIGYVLYRCFVRINAYKPANDKLKITKV
jgi:hypothetical protein